MAQHNNQFTPHLFVNAPEKFFILLFQLSASRARQK
jgi:hypothetical protein